jgi:riboflavin biosynthesis pyrimidine reductase
MKASTAGDLTVGGPTLAAHAFDAGLVDECQLFIHPVLVGGGKPAFPTDAGSSPSSSTSSGPAPSTPARCST